MNLNPYAMGQWSHTGNGPTGNARLPHGDPPTLGALPPTYIQSGSALKFEFSFPILNCVVTGPDQRNYFNIQTNSDRTVISSRLNEAIASIHWSEHPRVEARSGLALQPTAQFIALSHDLKYV